MIKNNYPAIALVIVILIAGIFVLSQAAKRTLVPATDTPQPTSISYTSPTPQTQTVLGIQTKTTDCHVNGALPDPECSPGAVFPNVTKDDVCKPGYATSVRNVSQSTKNKVYEEYGLPPTGHQPGEYEVDHIISLELGGSNDIANLWPEAADPRPGYHEKDKVENYLHDQVCSEKISLQQAQELIANNWLEVYQQISQ